MNTKETGGLCNGYYYYVAKLKAKVYSNFGQFPKEVGNNITERRKLRVILFTTLNCFRSTNPRCKIFEVMKSPMRYNKTYGALLIIDSVVSCKKRAFLNFLISYST